MKTYLRSPLLIIVLTVFSIFLVFHFAQSTKKGAQPQNKVINKEFPGLPMRLMIPSINVNSNIQQVGVNSKGEMGTASNSVDVGWFKIGPRPGEKGSAVISGHIDGENGEAGVFSNLYKLKKGDKLYLKDANGKTISFIVRKSRLYNPGYADEVFSPSDKAYLNLITCDGVWDGRKKSYSKRLVVFTDIIQ